MARMTSAERSQRLQLEQLTPPARLIAMSPTPFAAVQTGQTKGTSTTGLITATVDIHYRGPPAHVLLYSLEGWC